MYNNNTVKTLMEFIVPVTESGCWLWLGETQNEYGHFNIDGEDICVDKVFWEEQHGSIPNGECVYHKCNIKFCVNPDHLYLGV